MQSRTGHGLGMLMLDEPTENLGSEDGSIERLAEAISRFKAIEQIIAVTHSEAFAGKADHVITLGEGSRCKQNIHRALNCDSPHVEYNTLFGRKQSELRD